MRGRLVCLILSILSVLIMTGCSEIMVTEEFMDKDWLFYDEVTAEHLKLTFASDGTFSYHCQCGEGVGDSDLYDQYEYDEEAGIIKLFNSSDDATSEIEVVRYNIHHLMLRIDEEVKDFTQSEWDIRSNFWSIEGEDYLLGYNCICTLIDVRDGKIICGPVEYDPEGINEDGPFEEYELLHNPEISELSIRSFNSIQGDQEYEEYYEVDYREMSREEFSDLLECGSGLALLWFDDDLKVEKIMFVGEVSVTQN